MFDHGRNTVKSAFLSPLDLDEEPTTQQRTLIKQKQVRRRPSTRPPEITRGQQCGGGGSDRLFISGYYGNENAL